MATIAQTIIASLLARGWVIADHPTKRYTALRREGDNLWIFVGRFGAARFARDGRVTDSIPLSDRMRAALLGGRKDNDNARSI